MFPVDCKDTEDDDILVWFSLENLIQTFLGNLRFEPHDTIFFDYEILD